MDTIFITGGSFILGSCVICRLLPGFRILASTHRNPLPLADGKMEVLPGGLENCRGHAPSIQTARVIAHLAAVSHSDDESQYPPDQGNTWTPSFRIVAVTLPPE